MHYTPNESITFTFYEVKFPLYRCKPLTCISYDLFISTHLLWKDNTYSLCWPVHIQYERFYKVWSYQNGCFDQCILQYIDCILTFIVLKKHNIPLCQFKEWHCYYGISFNIVLISPMSWRKAWTLVTNTGIGNFMTTLTFCWYGSMPLLLVMCPK